MLSRTIRPLFRYLAAMKMRRELERESDTPPASFHMSPPLYEALPHRLPYMPTKTLLNAYLHYLSLTHNQREAVGCALIDVTHRPCSFTTEPCTEEDAALPDYLAHRPPLRHTRRLAPL